MSNIRLHNVTCITPTGLIPNCTIDIADGKIQAVHDYLLPQADGMQWYDMGGAYAAPGFIDVHLHGGGGISFMEATCAEDIKAACVAHARHGTTTIVPTSTTAPIPQLCAMIEYTHQAQAITKECTIAGVHLEGPFLSPAQCGAQSLSSMLHPTPEYLEQLLAPWPEGVRIIGAAPELPGGYQLGELLQEKGIVASIAHSDADYDQCAEALKHGYTDITHIYSGCSIVHRTNAYRHGGVVEAGLLEDGFTVQMIADGKHLPAELLKLIYKCKGPDHICLITDALKPAGCDLPDGTIFPEPGEEDRILEDGVMKLISRQAFAGSIATTDRLVRNMVNLANVPLWDAVTMMTATPAKLIGMDHCKGYLKAGYDADIVILDEDLQVKSVMAMGQFIAE